MSYDKELQGCFSEPDQYLAVHPPEQRCAFAWLAALRERAATWSEVKVQIEAYLRERDATPFHILDQIERAAVLFKPWLYGPDNDE
jgi:hypothetical protein